MKKTNILMLTAIAAGSAAVWAVSAIPSVKLQETRKTLEREGVERIIPIGEPSMLPEAGYYTVPFNFGPTQEEFNECLFPEAVCEKQYSYDSTEHAFKANYTPSGTYCDYWGLFPGVQMEPGVYKLSFEVKTKNDKEKFAITIGNERTPEAQTEVLVSFSDYSNTTYQTYEKTFTITDTGIYYVGMHHYSDPYKFNVYLRNFSIVKVDSARPCMPTITSYDFEDGIGSLTIAVPSEELSANPLSGDINVHVLIDGEEIEGSPFVAQPGEELVVPMTLSKGNHQFQTYATAVIGGEEKTSDVFSEIHRITKIIPIPSPIPAHFDCDEDEYSICTVINANDDTSYWKYNETGASGYPGFQYAYSSSNPADDYVVFPALDCNEVGIYQITCDILTKNDDENVKIYLVDNPSLESLREATPILELNGIKHFDEWKQYKAKAGVSSPGQKYLVIYACSARYKGYIYLKNINVTLDDPRQIAQPAFGEFDFDGGDGTVEVVLPATTLAGVALGDVTIEGAINEGAEVLATFTGVPGETVSVPLTGLSRGMHTLSAAVNYTVDGTTFSSDPIETRIQIFRNSSFAYQIPFEMSLKDATLADDLMIINVNEDDKTFVASNDGLKYSYHSSNEADDWVIFLPMDVTETEDPLEVTLTSKSNKTYPENFSVWLGTERSIEGMNIEVMPETTIQTDVLTDFTSQVALPSPGRYYLGIHCTSIANQLTLYFTNLQVKYGIDDSLFPQPVADLAAVADPTGALQATVSFTMPTLTINGTEMAEDTLLTATVTCGENEVTLTGAPGEEVSTPIGTLNGLNTVSVVIANEEGVSVPAEASVRCGLDTPVKPVLTDARNGENGYDVELSWEPVTTGVNGGIINPDLVQYRVTPWDDDDQDWDYTESVYTTDTHCVFAAYPNSRQRYLTLGIEAFQNASTNSAVTSIQVVMGKPIELDVEEDFANQQFNAGICYALSIGNTNPSWYLSDGQWDGLGELYDPDNYILRGSCFANAQSLVLFPMMSTMNIGSAEVSFELWNGLNTAKIEGVMATYGLDREIISEVPAYEYSETAGWKTYTFQVPETYMGRPWIQPGLFCTFDSENRNKVMINSYSVTATSQVGTREVVASNISVAGQRETILIGGAKGQKVVVSDLSGKVIFSEANVAGPLTIPAAQGVYVVRAGEKTFKVVVK